MPPPTRRGVGRVARAVRAFPVRALGSVPLRELPGRAVTADLDTADTRTFGFPDSLAPYVPLSFYGYVYLIPTQRDVVAPGCSRIVCLRVPAAPGRPVDPVSGPERRAAGRRQPPRLAVVRDRAAAPVWDRGSPAAILCSCLTRPPACRFPIPRAESPSTAFCTRATELLGPAGRAGRR